MCSGKCGTGEFVNNGEVIARASMSSHRNSFEPFEGRESVRLAIWTSL